MNDLHRRILIYTLCFCSGFSIMGIELLGGRILAPFFGSSIHIWGSIITVFMVSLSIGYLLGGRLSVSTRSLKMFAFIYIFAGLWVLPIAFYSNSIMELIFINIEDTRYGSLLASSCLFLIPTIILGMISPYSVRLLVDNHHESGKIAGKLYFVSTLGSALGTIITSFYLVLLFDINQIVLGFSLVLLSLGLITMNIAVSKGTRMENKVSHVYKK